MTAAPPRVEISDAHYLNHPKGALVEIVEPVVGYTAEDLPCIKPSMVRVNGVDVGLLAHDGIELNVDIGDNKQPTTITLTLTLMPRSITVKAEDGNVE